MSVGMQYPASYSPLILRAQITAPGGGGELGVADTTLLENPFQGPMWLDEIRFRLPSAPGGFNGAEWSSIYAKFLLTGANIPLTQTWVPIGLFGKVLNDSENAENLGSVTLDNVVSPDVFTWRLPKPLFIPARELLRPTIYFQPYSGSIDTLVTIEYACRPLPVGTPMPKKLQVPWVASYVPSFLTAGTTDQIDQSQPSDLYNPWDQDLHVQRFVGRFMGQNTAGEYQGNMDLASASVDDNGNVTTGTLVTAQDSFNNILIRDPTPFAHVFNQLDRAWTVNCVLPSKGYYLFDIQRLWSGSGASTVGTVGISMVGWREVDYV